jgi:hypothetical protein
MKSIDPSGYRTSCYTNLLIERKSDDIIPKLTEKNIMRVSEGFNEAGQYRLEAKAI